MPEDSGFEYPTPPDLPTNADVTQLILRKAFDVFEDLCNQGSAEASWAWIKGVERFIMSAWQNTELPTEDYIALLHRAHGRCWMLRFGN